MTLSQADLDALKVQIETALKESVPRMIAEELAKPASPAKGSLSDAAKLQFDYAWKWFSYHADQRIKMFNYMLLAVGIFATAIVGAINNGFVIGAVVACTCAALLLGAFSRLDQRNRDLVGLGEDLLRYMEESALFADDKTFAAGKPKGETVALLRRQDAQDAATPWLRRVFLGGRHRFWLPAITYGLGLVFLVSAAWLSCNAALFAKAAPVIKMPDSISVRLAPPGSK